MLGKFHSFCECFVAGKEGVLGKSLFEGAFGSTDVDFSCLILGVKTIPLHTRTQEEKQFLCRDLT